VVGELIPQDIEDWLRIHPTWNGARKSAIQAVKRAINYCLEQGLVKHSHIQGYNVRRPKGRVILLTPEQEETILQALEHNREFSQLLWACIRTGARPISEYGAVEAWNVEDYGDRMEWKWPDGTKVRGKKRVIKITEPWIIERVRQQVKR
jgi:integrase